MDLHYETLFLEAFKDGNIFDREIKPGEKLVLDELTYKRVVESGALVEKGQMLIKNPLKDLPKDAVIEEPVVHEISLPVVGQEPDNEKFNAKYERWAEEDGEPLNQDTVLVKRKAGRPKGSKNKRAE